MESLIPNSVPSSSRYLVNSSPGGVVTSNFFINIGESGNLDVSPDSNWKVSNYTPTITPLSFDRLRRRVGLSFSDTTKEFNSGGAEEKEISQLETGTWYTKDDLLIDTPQTISQDKHLIIFVGSDNDKEEEGEGDFEARDLEIKKNILITDNSTLIFITSKDIYIDPEVTELHGIFLAAGNNAAYPPIIHTGEKEPEGTDSQLKIYGSLITSGNSQIYLERDLGKTLNQTTPSELVICQAKYFLYPTASFFKGQVKGWKEVAP